MKSHICLTLAHDVKQKCDKWLKLLKIESFQCAKIYPSGKRTVLASDAYFLDMNYINRKFKSSPKRPTGQFFSDFSIASYDTLLAVAPTSAKAFYRENVQMEQQMLSIKDGLMISQPMNDHVESWCYLSGHDIHNVRNHYLEHYQQFKLFEIFVRSECDEMLRIAEKNPVLTPEDTFLECDWGRTDKRILTSPKDNGLEIRSYPIRDGNQTHKLTWREAECLSLWLRCRTTQEIGSIMHLSHRTVETHLSNVKDKLNCTKRSDLYDLAEHSGFDHRVFSYL